MTTYFFNIVALLGGLALFLFGMDTMGKALERQAGGKLQTILAKMSSNVFKGFLLGMAVTAVIQSSSATTVMVVGFVNSGIMTLKQAVGVIMGSNIGTTVTAWILSLSGLEGDSFIISLFKPSTLAPLVGIIGAALFMFAKSDKKKGIGVIALGFLALMTGMDVMGDAMAFLKNEPWFAQLMISFTNPILGIIFGALLTALIQSSSASIGILQSLCSTGAVTFGAALPIILGQNIGTCITAMMGAIGANRNARRTALVHLLFNVVGVLLFSVIFYGLGIFIDWAFLTETAKAWDIAVIHTLFNVGATAVLMPMNGLLVKLAYLFIPAEPVHQAPVLLDERLLATPAVAVQQAHSVATKMGRDAADAMHYAMKLTENFDQKTYDKVIALEDETDRLEEMLGTYLLKLSAENLSVEDNRSLNTLLYSIADIERIGDHAVEVAKAAQEMQTKSIVFSPEGQEEQVILRRAVEDVVERTIRAYAAFDRDEAMKVEPLRRVVNTLIREIKSRHVRRLRDGICTVEHGFVVEDMLTAFGRTADHCSNVAVEILQVSEGKLEAHSYLSDLKAGKLDESAAYDQRMERYTHDYFIDDEEFK